MNELSGGIKNALERGESLESIKRSFINAGYNPKEVGEAISDAGTQNYNTSVVANEGKIQPGYQPLPAVKPVKEKKSHLKFIVMGVVCLLILVCVGIVGLYWDKLMSLFGL